MAGNYLSNPSTQWLDDNGDPLSGGTIDFWEAGGTSVRLDTFTDVDLTGGNENANPVVLASDGRSATAIVLQQLSYNIVVKNSAGTVQTNASRDNVSNILQINIVGTPEVDNIAAMTALLKANLTDLDVYNVLGHTTVADGGQGPFQWVAASTATVNIGTIFASGEGGNGRWLRVFTGPLELYWFGPNTTPGTTNMVTIAQAFFDTIPLAGGRGRWPEDEVLCEGTDLFYRHFIQILGDGYGSWMHMKDAALKFDATKASVTEDFLWHFRFGDIRLSRTGTVGPAMHMVGDGLSSPTKGVARGAFDRLHISGSTGQGILATDTFIHDWGSIIVTGCAAAGIEFDINNTSGCLVINMQGGVVEGNLVNILCKSINGLTLIGLDNENATDTGLELTQAAGRTCESVILIGGHFEGNGSASTDFDIKIGVVGTNTPASVICLGVHFTDGSVGKDYAIEGIKCQGFNSDSCIYKGYGVAGIKFAPDSSGEFTGTHSNNILSNSTPLVTDAPLNTFFVEIPESKNWLTATKVVDVASIAAGNVDTFTVTVTGAVEADFVEVSTAISVPGDMILKAEVTSADTVTVSLNNVSSGAINLADGTYNILVKPKLSLI